MDDRYCVPDFEINDDYFMPSTSGINRSKKSAMVEDEMMELLWQNGQVVAQSQNQKSGRKSRGSGAEVEAEGERTRTAAEETARQHVFMQEDEMASWLHYPFDEPEPEPEPEFDPPPSNKGIAAAPSTEIRVTAPEIRAQSSPSLSPSPAPQPQSRRVDLDGSSMFQDFMHFARLPREAAEESTAVGSNSAMVPVSRNSTLQVGRNMSANEAATRDLTRRCELTMASSPGCSGASAERPLPPPPPATAEDRKRKGRETNDNEDNSLGIEFESGVTKKQVRGSTSTKKSRAAEVHNLSERKRRDRINEKMKALQELIPRCNKSDKASMLDEAIEYLKSLQLQVQMMSMGCSMVPMMYPGMQHYMPAAMGMMDMGMNRPMVQYPHVIPAGSGMPTNLAAAAAGHMGSRFPMPAFHMLPVPDPSRVQPTNASDSTLNSTVTHSVNQPRYPNFIDPYHQYRTLHHGQVPLPQNQPVQTSTEKPSSSRKVSTTQNH